MKTIIKCVAACVLATFFFTTTKARACRQAAKMSADTMLNLPAPDFVLKDLDVSYWIAAQISY